MSQTNRVLTGEGNRLSFIAAGRTTMQEDCLSIAEGELPMNAIEQTCVLEVGEKTSVGGTIPKLVRAPAKIVDWLNHLGNVRINDRYLESRHNIHHNFKMNAIRS